MTGLRCPNCGFYNLSARAKCARCGKALPEVPPDQKNIFPEDEASGSGSMSAITGEVITQTTRVSPEARGEEPAAPAAEPEATAGSVSETGAVLEPEPAPEPEPLPPSVAVTLDYSKNWALTLNGRFRGNQRIIRNGEAEPSVREGLDLWWWHGDTLNFRLYNGKIFFTQCHVGNPYAISRPSDHWAATAVSCKFLRQQNPSMLTIMYRYSTKRVTMFANGAGVMDFSFRVDSMPSPRRKLWLIGFVGDVTVQEIKP